MKSAPVVVVVERPQDDPDVLWSGDVEVVEVSAYPASAWCSDSEVLDYGADYLSQVIAARDRFQEDSLNWLTLNELVELFTARLAAAGG